MIRWQLQRLVLHFHVNVKVAFCSREHFVSFVSGKQKCGFQVVNKCVFLGRCCFYKSFLDYSSSTQLTAPV